MFPTQEQQQQQQRCDSEWRRRKDDEITKVEVRAIMLLAGRLAGPLAGKVQEGRTAEDVEGACLHLQLLVLGIRLPLSPLPPNLACPVPAHLPTLPCRYQLVLTNYKVDYSVLLPLLPPKVSLST